jgi:hypothetical protein
MELPMYIGIARRKTSRSKPDRVFRQSLISVQCETELALNRKPEKIYSTGYVSYNGSKRF